MRPFLYIWIFHLAAGLTLLPAIGNLNAQEVITPGMLMELIYLNQDLKGASKPEYLSPADMVPSPDGTKLYIAEYTGKRIDIIDPAAGTILQSIAVPMEPTGLALSSDGGKLYVTCYSDQRPEGVISVINTSSGIIELTFKAGHSPRAPILSPAGDALYICNQFAASVSVFEPSSGALKDKITLNREPYAMALTPDGATLVVTNLLPHGPSDVAAINDLVEISAEVSIVNTSSMTVEADIPLSDGSHSLLGAAISSDGNYAYVTHVLSRYAIPPTKIEQGWINSNGLAVIDLKNLMLINTVLMDNSIQGAANLWDVTVGENTIFVTAAGAHELITIKESEFLTALNGQGDQSYSLTFTLPYQERKILSRAKGPRSVAVTGGKVYTAGYFSDNIDVYAFGGGSLTYTGTIDLQEGRNFSPPLARKGEALFYDALICHQKWQTCASCHPFVRTDGLNWDLGNDNINGMGGNMKNDKSLILSHYTAPAMWSGVRDSAEVAVRAGIQFILFSMPREDDAVAIDAFLKGLRPIPSPFLVEGRLSASALRGKDLFYNKFNCAACHPPPLYTDKQFHDIGTKESYDLRSAFDTPTLRESWRTAPYLHVGKYGTLKDLFKEGWHGISVKPTEQELDDLVEYNNSL